MAASREVKVTIVGDSDSMVRAFRTADKAASGFHRGGSALLAAGMGAVAGVAATAAAAIGDGLVMALRTGVDEMQQQEKVSAQTAAALKSTGNAAGVTKGHIEAMASALQAQTGMQDDAIQSGQNLLLTFTNISNKGPDKMFDRATKAALDLSVAFHKDLNGSSVLVGKALNDPVKGLTALGRVGVQFTASQKATIKSLVETGQAAKAQKLILGELEKQVGGSAKAFGDTTPGQIQKAKRAFEDLSQGAVSALAPIGAAVLPALVTAMQGTVTWFQSNWPKIKAVAMQVWDWFRVNLLPTFMEIGRGIGSIVQSIVGIFRQYWPQIMAVVRPIVEQIKNVIVTTFAVIKGVINFVSSLLKGDFAGAWRALTGIVGAVIRGVVNSIKNIGTALLAAAAGIAKAAFDLGVKIAGAIVRGIASAPANIVRIVAGWFGADSVGTGASPFAVKNGKVVGMALGQGMAQGLMTGAPKVQQGIGEATGKASEGAKGSASAKAKPIGQAMSDGIAQGVRANGPNVGGAIGDIIRQGIENGRAQIQAKSPSRLTARVLGEPIADGVAHGIKSQQQKVTKSLIGVMKNAVASAKSNLISLAGTLGGMIGTARTSGDSARLAGLQSGLSARQSERQHQSLIDAKAAADADVLAKEAAVATAADPIQAQQDLTDARKAAADAAVALQDWQDQKEIDDLQTSIDTRKTKYQEDMDNLAAQFANGKISATEFQAKLTELIGGDTGDALGSAFALNFQLALTGLLEQLKEINQIAGSAGVGPSGPNVEKPKQTWNEAVASVRQRLESNWEAAHPDGDVNSAAAQAWVKTKLDTWKKNHAALYGVALAKGGIVDHAMHALIGEAGPEAVIPLSSGRGKDMLAKAGAGGGPVINLTFNGVLDAKDAARMLRPELDRLVRLAV